MRPEEYQSIAMQSLLPGLQVAAERAVESLNKAREVLGLEPLVLQRATKLLSQSMPARITQPPDAFLIVDAYSPEPDEPPAAATELEKTAAGAPKVKETPGGAVEPAPRRVMTPSAKKKLISFTAERWRIVKEAGLDPGGRLPTNEMLEKAKKILARRAARGGRAARA